MNRKQFDELKKNQGSRKCIYQYLGAAKNQICFTANMDTGTVWVIGANWEGEAKEVSYKSVDLLL